MKRILCVLLILLLIIAQAGAAAEGTGPARTVHILFTHDMHSYYGTAKALIGGEVHEHGNAARLKTLLDQNTDENTIYLDAGDFSMGTLLQAGFLTDAYELRLLGQLGCAVTTFGNHEFDFGGDGAATMLRAAMEAGDPLPAMVQSNILSDGELTETQQNFKDAADEYGIRDHVIREVGGVQVGIFGLLGIDGISCSPTSGLNYENYIEAAKKTVEALKAEGAELIVCLSHSGTSGDGVNGEDFDLAKQVPNIDFIVSGHSHTTYQTPVRIGNTYVASAGEYLTNLGSITFSVSDSGVECTDYRLIRCDETVEEDPGIAAVYDEYKQHIEQTYLANEDCAYDEVICHTDFSFMPLGEMYATHQEYPLGNLIADSYLYEARRNGIDDIDVALVGLGTIRGAFFEGDITVSDAFEICSLGAGYDGTAGHPLLGAYITGKELKLLVELDASLGPMVSSIKMSYSGLKYTFNTERIILDRSYDAVLVREDGAEEEIEDDRLYKVCCNMYAANMLGMLNGLTKGILSITPKYADGTPITDFYDCSLFNTDGREIKEWIAFKNYLSSLPLKNGVPAIPDSYASAEGRKAKISEGGLAIFAHPGLVTWVVIDLGVLLIGVIAVLLITRRKRWARRARKKAEHRAKKALKSK